MTSRNLMEDTNLLVHRLAHNGLAVALKKDDGHYLGVHELGDEPKLWVLYEPADPEAYVRALHLAIEDFEKPEHEVVIAGLSEIMCLVAELNPQISIKCDLVGLEYGMYVQTFAKGRSSPRFVYKADDARSFTAAILKALRKLKFLLS